MLKKFCNVKIQQLNLD